MESQYLQCDELATSTAIMDAKIFCLLALLGVAYGFNFQTCGGSSDASSSDASSSDASSTGASSTGAVSADLTAQLSVALRSEDHTSLLDLAPFGDAKSFLASADFSKVTELKWISPVQKLAVLPPLPNMRESFEKVRARIAASLGAAEVGLEEAIHQASVKAIHAADAVAEISEIVFTILSAYFEQAKEAAEVITASALIAEGLSVSVNAVVVIKQSIVII